VWRVRPVARAAAEALEFLRRWTPGVDAYVIVRGHVIAAAMPSPDAVSAMELADDRYDSAGWSSVLAAVVHDDRAEHVGGTRHARPAVALR